MLAFGEFAVNAGDLRDLFRVDFVALVAEALAHLAVEIDRIDELHFAFALALLAVGHDPDIGADAGVVEELIGEGDDGFQPIVLNDPAADFAFAGAGIAGEEGRSIEDDADAGALAVLVGIRLHLGDHVLEEEERPIVDARDAGTEAAVVALALVLLDDGVLSTSHFTPKGGLASM